jgi:hypothetical protein
VGIFVSDEGAQWRQISNEVADDNASLSRFGARDSQCDVRGRDWIAGGDYCGVIAAEERCDLTSSVFPCNGTPAGNAWHQGDPS